MGRWTIRKTLLATLLGASVIAHCGAAESSNPAASTEATAPANTVTTATEPAAISPPPEAPPSSAEASYSVAAFEPGEAIAPRNAYAARVTNQRLSFDAAAKPGAAAYESLRGYFLDQDSIALLDALRRSNHQTLLAPQDEFEPTATYDARLQRWMDAAQSVFASHFAARNWEVFGIPVPADQVWYNANKQIVVLPYPPVPGIADLRATDFQARFLPDASARGELRNVPLFVDDAILAPLRCEMRQDVGRLEVPVASAEAARAVKQDLVSGRAFYYVRFEPEVKREVWDDYGSFVGSTHRQMRVIKRVDLSLLLRVTEIAVYVSEPPHAVWVFRMHATRPANLWFLAGAR